MGVIASLLGSYFLELMGVIALLLGELFLGVNGSYCFAFGELLIIPFTYEFSRRLVCSNFAVK